MQFLRKSLLWIVLLGSIAAWVYVDIVKAGVCEEPIKYSLGLYDSRFDITKTEFKSAVDEAAAVWEIAIKKNLFAYEAEPKPAGPFHLYIGRLFVRKDIPVNLVYDDRQEQSEAHRALVSEVNEQKESAEAVRAQFEALQAEYERSASEYQSMVGQYRKRKISYEALEAKRQLVNALANEINALVKKYNYQVSELNQIVKTINQNAGQEFEEGQYILDREGERINIYEFGDRETLVRVLAHEFGHALGLEHNDNPDSIMYYLNESSNLKPTKEDLDGLALICKGA